MLKSARIIGKVEYREGDGVNITIRPGPCEVEEAAQDVTISWNEGDSRTSVAMPVAIYQGYIANKAIVADEVMLA